MPNVNEVFNEINALRKSKNLKEYKWNHLCAGQAYNHSLAMSQGRTKFSHDGMNDRFKNIEMQTGKIFRGSENVYYSSPEGNPVKSWKLSAGHNKNLLGNYEYCGIGKAIKNNGECWFTAIFCNLIEKDNEENKEK